MANELREVRAGDFVFLSGQVAKDENGNMISGFALIAWPAKYGETGVSTFVINQAGVIYERDFGTETDNIAPKILTFNPGDNWELVDD